VGKALCAQASITFFGSRDATRNAIASAITIIVDTNRTPTAAEFQALVLDRMQVCVMSSVYHHTLDGNILLS
jgi:hypothetical protein